MTSKDFESMKGFEIITVKRIKTYRASAILATLLLTFVLVMTFIYFVLPLKAAWLTGAFIGGIIAGVYTMVMEIIFPEKHLHWYFKLPEDYNGWKVLYMISKCIQYEPKENIIVVEFMEGLDKELENILYDLIDEYEAQD